MNLPKLVISLDFELIWGVFDHFNVNKNKDYFDNTLYIIPKLLDKFAKHEIHVTWATVGMLGNENWDEWHTNIPSLKPTYINKKLDAFAFGKQHLKSGLDRFFFAPQLITQICDTPFQELGSHTYSHYYCLEKGQNLEQFESDLKATQKIFSKWSLSPNSLVFPRNQYNKDYLNVCSALGITSVRSNPSNWYWDAIEKSTISKKIFRTADAYLPLGTKTYFDSEISLSKPLNQKSSRFLRPQSRFSSLELLKLSRIKNEIMYAAKNNKCYHLWWHPHNFGNNPKEALNSLDKIIDVIIRAKEYYNLQSLSMKEFEISITNKI